MRTVIGAVFLACATTASLIEDNVILSPDHASTAMERKLQLGSNINATAIRVFFPQLTDNEFNNFLGFYQTLGLSTSKQICYVETNDFFNFEPRALPFYAGRGDGFNTKETCGLQCFSSGYLISGLGSHETCFCADTGGYQVGLQTITYDFYGIDFDCDCSKIQDDEICTQVIEINYEFVGCFKDDIPRALPIVPRASVLEANPFPIKGKSFAECALLCFDQDTGYQYMGRQFDQECFCGSGFTHAVYGEILEGDADYCDCDGTNIGFFRQCVYKIPDEKWDDKIIFLGAFSDFGDPKKIASTSDTTRALPDRIPCVGCSIDKCASHCRNADYDLFGIQHRMECWCGNSQVDDPYRYGATTTADCDNLENVGFFVFCLFAITDPGSMPSQVPSLEPSLSSLPTLTDHPSMGPSQLPSLGPSTSPN